MNAGSAGGLAVAAALLAAPALAEVPNNNLNRNAAPTLAGANDVNGVGIIYSDYGSSGGVCTGTLVNPRYVLFAAHCVNTQAQTAYGAASGGTPIAVSFKGDARAGLISWIQSGYRSSVATQTYNINQIFYNSLSLAQPLGNFYEADVAMGVLDTPTRGVPTWAMLFSPLTGDENLHVTIGGYGWSGTGTTGQSQAIDFRRRSGENMIGALTSIDDINLWLFGNGGQRGLGQNLYLVDFDDPARTNIYDFNLFGNDVALPGEGMTAQGDSGSALILDKAFDIPVIAGVLSLGTRYYANQPAASYGTTSGYQPLYLFWDYIVANNPYKYVSANAGDADWFDATHWTQNIDPNYKIISNGKLVTGLPSTPAAGVDGQGGEFGAICFRTDCIDADALARFNEQLGLNGDSTTPDGANSSDGGLIVSRAELFAGLDDAVVASTGGESYAPVSADAPEGMINAPQAVTPNNAAASTANGNKASYYDVTLAAAGRTRLNAAATVDRLTIGGSGAILDIGSTGALTSLIDTTISAGQLNVDGAFSTYEMLVLGGLVSGRGQINATALTSILGAIAPGGQGSVGNLSLNGDLILTSGSRLFVDVSGATSDRFIVRPNVSTGATGGASVGGLLNLNFLTTPSYGQTWTVLSAEGGVTGRFTAVGDISGVLYPTISYTARDVNVQIAAESFSRFLDAGSRTQTAVGGLLDTARGSGYSALSGIYNVVDVLEGTALGGSLESLAPYAEWSAANLGVIQTETFQSVIGRRLSIPRSGAEAPQGLALIGNGVQVAALDAAPYAVSAAARAEQAQRDHWTGGWKSGMAGFLSAGATNGEAGQLRGTLIAGQKEDIDSWYVAGGLERTLDGLTVGGAVGYAQGEADYGGGLSKAESKQLQLSAYGAVQLGDVAYVGAHLGWSTISYDTERKIALGASTFRTEGDLDGDVLFAGAELGARGALGGLKITPSVGFNAYRLTIDDHVETGSIAAFAVRERELQSLQGFVGVRFDGRTTLGGLKVQPALSLRAVAEMSDDNNGVTAAFAAANGNPATFVGVSRDKGWGEVSGGVTFSRGGRTSLSLEAASMIERDDVDYQTYRATVSVKF